MFSQRIAAILTIREMPDRQRIVSEQELREPFKFLVPEPLIPIASVNLEKCFFDFIGRQIDDAVAASDATTLTPPPLTTCSFLLGGNQLFAKSARKPC